MDKVKLEDFRCNGGYSGCRRPPKPGDKIYMCSGCIPDHGFRCEACVPSVQFAHTHGGIGGSLTLLRFQPILTKLVSEHFTPTCDESQKRKFFCSNSKNGCQEEFLAQKAHENSCIYQKVPCPSLNCKEFITFNDVNNHMEQSHNMLKVNKEWNFEGTKKDLHEIICCLSNYDQKFFPQVFVKEKNLYFKVIMLDHQVNTIPFDVTMTFFLEDGKNILMKDRIYPVNENGKEAEFSKVSLEKITEYFDAKSMEWKCQPKIDFCLKIVNEKMDEIAKDKNAKVESGK